MNLDILKQRWNDLPSSVKAQSRGFEGLEDLCNLVKERKCVNILEIGTFLGRTACYMGATCAPLGGKVTTINVNKLEYESAKSLAEELELDNIDFRLGNSLDIIPELDGNWDLVFIDGHHSYKYSMSEYDLVKDRMKPDSIIILDDVNAEHNDSKGDGGVPRTAREVGAKITFFGETKVGIINNCFICGSPIESIPVKDLIHCSSCDILRRSEVLSREELKEDGKNFLLSACRNPVTRASRMNDAKSQLDVLDKYMKPGRLYDVGAAGGFFMKAAQDRGWEVNGNELSVAGTNWAKKNFDLNIFCGFLEDDILEENYFDVIVMWNILEHLDFPLQALKLCYQSVHDNGYVFIKVPCKGIYDIEDVRNRYEHLHLTEFSREGLIKILSRTGFSVELETYDNEGGKHIMVLAKKKVDGAS